MIEKYVTIEDYGKIRKEWFIRGTETPVVLRAESPATCHIAYPVSGTIIALDPDIPVGRQKLFFEARPEGNPMHWVLDGKLLGSAAALTPWAPVRGKHSLALVDDRGDVIDTVAFEVRGSLE